MIKDIKYSGYSAQPSDYECQDGDLATSINLINEDGNIKPLHQAKKILSLQIGESVLFIHNVPGQKNYILARGRKDASFELFWVKKDASIHNTNSATLIGTMNSLLDVTAVGNTLVFALKSGLKYLLWKDDNYKLLNSHPPFIAIDFGMYKAGTRADSDSYTISNRCDPSWSGQRDQADSVALADMTQSAYGLLNPAMAEITKQGFFYQPFFVRYAYRLYDGSYCWHSAPILMLPTILPPIIKYSKTGSSGNEVTATFQLDINYFALAFRILSDGTDELKDWADIVAGIDVFVSAPIYTYDQSADLTWRPVQASRSMLLSLYDRSPNRLDPRNENYTTPSSVFVGHYADNIDAPYIDHAMSTAADDSFYMIYIKHRSKMHDDIRNCHDFYKIAEIDIKDIKAMDKMTRLNLSNIDLSALVTRERMTDDYQSHCELVPTSLYSFNSRLNLAGLEISPAKPYPLRSCMQFGNPSSYPMATSVRIKVWTRMNGSRCIAVREANSSVVSDSFYSPQSNFPRYIFYPDASAYKMEIYISDSVKYTINLVPHEFLNGAFYYSGDFAPDTTPVSAEAETGTFPTSVPIGSKLYTSEINNPFIFPLLGINTIGSGSIIGICSAAKALSQGQFGQFPLYAFTTEGVWALETSSTGTYTAKQPITRDVCVNANSITQIDSAVLFATDRGIMLISGSQTQCLSDIINSDTPFDVTTLPGYFNMGTFDDGATILPFSKFMEECQMIYDYTHQHIIAFSPQLKYAYVYSLKSHQWGIMHSDIVSAVNSYPEAIAVDRDNHLVDFSLLDGDISLPCLLVTRPLKLDAPDILKTIDCIIQRGNFRKGHVQSVVYGSRDLYNWSLVWSSKDHYLRGFRGTPYKYFRIALLCNLAEDESIYGATVRYDTRMTNQPR